MSAWSVTINEPNISMGEKPDSWSATAYNKTASFVYSKAYTSKVLTLLGPKPGEKIFDFGCGSGEVSLQIQEIVGKEGHVVGVDSSESMVRIPIIWRHTSQD
jgi:ubiquinone/menaquinone biosynthesis C-methylase UbiE